MRLIVNGKPLSITPAPPPGIGSNSGADDTGIAMGVPGMDGGAGTSGGSTPPPAGAPAVLSGINWHQPEPIDPAAADYTLAGWGTPADGIGPFVYTVSGNNNFAIYGSPGQVRVFDHVDTSALQFTLTVTDGRGAIASTLVTVQTAASSPTISCNDINPISNCTTDTYYQGPYFRAGCQGHSPDQFSVTLQDGSASTQWTQNYEAVRWYQGGAATIPPGSYPIQFHANGVTAPHNFTIQIEAFSTVGYIEFVPVSVSTSTLGGRVIGNARATTPRNSPGFVIDDHGANLLIVNSNGQVRLKGTPSAVGSYPFKLTVVDGNYSYSQDFVLSVVQGYTLDDTHMTMALRTDFTNYCYRAAYIQRPVASAAPTVTGFPDASKVSWYVSKMQRWNFTMDNPPSGVINEAPRAGIGYPRFACDPVTGLPFVQAYLSDTTGTSGEWFDLTGTDGIYTCTKRFYLPVAPVVGPKWYVGPNAPPTGFAQKASLTEAMAPFIGYDPNHDITAVAGAEIRLEYDPANPNRYVDDWEQNFYTFKANFCGPLKIIGIPGPNGELPFWGRPIGTSAAGPYEKGLLVMNSGDLTVQNVIMGYLHMGVFNNGYAPGSNDTLSAIRQNGGCSGDIRLTNVIAHDCDVILEAGDTDGQWILNQVYIYNGSGCTSSGGANQHNAYIGKIWNLVVTDLLSLSPADGHIFKCRAANGTWTRCRFYDGERGSSFNALDLCCGGNHTLTDCEFEKGPMSMNPYLMQFAEEVDPAADGGIEVINCQDYVNALTLVRPKFIRHCTDLIGRVAINWYARIGANTGVRSTLTLTDPVFENIPQGSEFVVRSAMNPDQDFSSNVTMTGATYPTTFTPLNLIPPTTLNPGRPGWHDSVAWLNDGHDMPFFNGVQIDPGVDEIRIPANSAPGTVVCSTMRACGTPNWSLSGNAQPDPRINPFVSGTVWGNGQTQFFHTGESFGYANSHYTITTNPDGVTATLAVGPNGLAGAGLDVTLVRATSPSSTGSVVVENPLFVVKT